MLAVAVSLLFVIAAIAATAVIRSSLLTGLAGARSILAELAAIERRAGVTRPPARRQPQLSLQRELAAA